MAVYLVTYDLKSPGQSYQPVYDYLESFPDWCKGLASVYLIETAQNAVTVRNKLMSITDDNDEFVVMKVSDDWAAYNFFCAEWLNKPGRQF